MWGAGYDTGYTATAATAHGVASQTKTRAELHVPPPEHVADWLAVIVERDGAHAVVKALLKSVPAQRLMAIIEELCQKEFGDEPVFCSDVTGEGQWEAASPRTGSSSRKRARDSPADAAFGFKYTQCWSCEPDYGVSDGECECQCFEQPDFQLAFEEQEKKVHDADEFDDGPPSSEKRRAARYFLYRKWVYATHGTLGKHNRVRVPPCVVEYIRDRYREIGCTATTCPKGGPLYRCSQHGYTGHRAASPDI